jgi:hypothetical protein
LFDAGDQIDREVACRTPGAVGYRDEPRTERGELFDRCEQRGMALIRFRGKELEREYRLAAGLE